MKKFVQDLWGNSVLLALVCGGYHDPTDFALGWGGGCHDR